MTLSDDTCLLIARSREAVKMARLQIASAKITLELADKRIAAASSLLQASQGAPFVASPRESGQLGSVVLQPE